MVAAPTTIPRASGGLTPVPHAGWSAARRAILQAFATGEHLVALLGPTGVGKTCLLREIEVALRPQSIRVLRLESGDVDEHLLDTAPEVEVLLIDEADRMSEAALQAVAEREDCFAVLVDLPGLGRRLAPWPHRVVELAPLPDAEIRTYLAARMIIAELDATRLTDGAAAALSGLSAGRPRLLNLLLAMAFHEADSTGQEPVLAEHVTEAAALRAEAALPEMMPPPPEPAPDARPGSTGAIATPSRPPAPHPSRDLALLFPPQDPRPRRSRSRAAILVLGAAMVVGGLAWLAAREDLNPVARLPASGASGSVADASPLSTSFPPSAALAGAALKPVAPAQAAAVAPGATPPAGAMLRVVVTYPRSTPEAGRRAAALTAALSQAGLSVGTPFPLSRPSAGPELSYFFREDREAAIHVGQLGGLDASRAQLGPIGAASPRPGTIEVALAAPGAPGAISPAAGMAASEEASPQEDAAPPAATLASPPDAGAIPAEAASRGVLLAWVAGAEARPGCCFVEVIALGAGVPALADAAPREAFAAYSEMPEQQLVQLSGPGRYAWRVLNVSRPTRRYTASPWRHFTIGAPPS